jgi:hypothetical protein
MIKYLLYLLVIFSVIKLYRYRLRFDEQIIYASISLFLGIVMIDWLLPRSAYEKFGQILSKKDKS